MFTLVAWIHCFVYISNGVVTRGYIDLDITQFKYKLKLSDKNKRNGGETAN